MNIEQIEAMADDLCPDCGLGLAEKTTDGPADLEKVRKEKVEEP